MDIEPTGNEVAALRLSNGLLEQFRKSDLEELAALRTQLADAQVEIARMREALALCQSTAEAAQLGMGVGVHKAAFRGIEKTAAQALGAL